MFDIHDYDYDTDHDTDDDTNVDADDDTDDGERGNLYTTKAPSCWEYFWRQRLKK